MDTNNKNIISVKHRFTYEALDSLVLGKVSSTRESITRESNLPQLPLKGVLISHQGNGGKGVECRLGLFKVDLVTSLLSSVKLWSVTSDKLLLNILIVKPQLQDLNPDALQTASLQAQPPGCLQIFGLKPVQDLTLGNPLKLDEPKPPTLTLPTLKVPINPTNQQVDQAIDPEITWATTEGEQRNFL
ncbi:hypothetical protein DSO57_1004403 [Entomophthora muscae]|uniref:Uncharacterized protein n=1 Tax=Entomophthora muscae TaxID=34485 RepID=A0ACC2SXI0_9FUNG|nr:hypothetical protein DSO57_1004403 [Entomophthora muscae]